MVIGKIFVELINLFEIVQLRSAQSLFEAENVCFARYFSKDASTIVRKDSKYTLVMAVTTELSILS
jgi:hypothetical protein